MFRATVLIDLYEEGILSEVTGSAGGPFEVYEEQVHADDTVTFRIDAREHRDAFYERMRAAAEVEAVSKVDDAHLLIRKRAMGALPIIRENHGKLQGVDRVYGTKRVLDVMVFRLVDLRNTMEELQALGDVSLGKLVPIGEPSSRLTERQQTVMHLALDRGYFEWPRSVEARELAEELDVAHSTFLEHLRKAERKLLEGAFADESTTATPREREFLLSSG